MNQLKESIPFPSYDQIRNEDNLKSNFQIIDLNSTCNKCSNFCKLHLIDDKSLKIECQSCNYSESKMSIFNFLKNNKFSFQGKKCDNHISYPGIYTCSTCNSLLCFECYIKHKNENHEIIKNLNNVQEIENKFENYIKEKTEFYKYLESAIKVYYDKIEELKMKLINNYKLIIKGRENFFKFIDILFYNSLLNQKNQNEIVNILKDNYSSFRFNKVDNRKDMKDFDILSSQIQNNLLKLKFNVGEIKLSNERHNYENEFSNEPLLFCALTKSNILASNFRQVNKLLVLSKNLNLKKTIDTHHNNIITDILLLENRENIITASLDNSIILYEISEVKEDFRLRPIRKYENAHSDFIKKLAQIDNDRFASCSNDCSVKIFTIKQPYQELYTLNDQTDWVNSICVLPDYKILVSGSDNDSPKICFYNVDDYSLIQTINDVHCPDKNSLFVFKNNLILVGGYEEVCFIGYDNGNFNLTTNIKMDNLGFIVNFAILEDDYCLGGTSGGGFVIIKADSTYKYIENAHENSIVSLMKLISNEVISSDNKGVVKRWKY